MVTTTATNGKKAGTWKSSTTNQGCSPQIRNLSEPLTINQRILRLLAMHREYGLAISDFAELGITLEETYLATDDLEKRGFIVRENKRFFKLKVW